jgi:hypothetical protein
MRSRGIASRHRPSQLLPSSIRIPRARRASLRRTTAVVCGALLLRTAVAAETTPEAGAPDPWSGTYDVIGLTVDQKTGDTRRITGHIVLTRKQGHYAAAAELETEFPTHGGALRTDVIGTGEGKLEKEVLSGTAQTQLVIQTVPGVDTNFAFIPREVGPKLVSTWSARFDRDGSLIVELANRGEEGERYSPTKTTLRGKRVAMPGEAATAPSP